MARGGCSGASSGQQAKSERRILTPHVAHTETRAKPVDGHDGSWPRSLHVGVFHCLYLLSPPPPAAVSGCVCLAGRRVNCFYLIVADTNAHVACHSLTSCRHLPLASSLLGPILVRYLLWLWLWWRAFGNCSLGPAASVLPIVRGLCKIVIGSQLVAAVVGQLSRSGRHANVAAAAVAAVVTVV